MCKVSIFFYLEEEIESDVSPIPFGSGSSPNLSVDYLRPQSTSTLCSGRESETLRLPIGTSKERQCSSPNLSPPPSPRLQLSPINLSPKISSMCRKLMLSNENNSEPNSSGLTGGGFFSSSGPFGKQRSCKFPLPRRKISDSAVPISYTYRPYQHPLSSSANCGRSSSSLSSVNKSPTGNNYKLIADYY